MSDLGPQPRIELSPFALEVWSFNHWTAREVPTGNILHMKFFLKKGKLSLPLILLFSFSGYPNPTFLNGLVRVSCFLKSLCQHAALGVISPQTF